MNAIFKKALAVLPALLLAGTAGMAAWASPAADRSGYSAGAVLPDNQINRDHSYFDLRMVPGQRQTLEVEIRNEGGETLVVALEAVSASTNGNGVIDYKTPGVRDETLRTPFSDIATPEADRVTVAPHETATARVAVAMPERTFDGVLLGGIVVTKLEPGPEDAALAAATSNGSASIRNVYSYIIGVRITETDAAVEPGFQLLDVRADSYRYAPAVLHALRNSEAVIVKDMAVTASVRRDSGEMVATLRRAGVDMAPNSAMELAVPLEDGELRTGDYTSVLTVEYQGRTWRFTQAFRVGGDQAERINAASIPVQKEASHDWLLPALLLLLIALVLLLIALLLLRARREARRDRVAR